MPRLLDPERAWFHELDADEKRAKTVQRKLIEKVESAITSQAGGASGDHAWSSFSPRPQQQQQQ